MALRERLWVVGGTGLVGLVGTSLTAATYATGELPLPVLLMGGVSAGLTVLWLTLDRARIQRLLRARSTQQSGVAVALVGLAAALAVGANVLAQKHDVRWDLTSSERYGISPQTISVLEGLTTPVEIRAYFGGESIEKSSFMDLIKGYQSHTKVLDLRLIDPVLEPTQADQDGVDSQLGTIILATADKTQRLEAKMDEEAVTNALIRLTSSTEHTLCTTIGHGEIDVDDDMNPAAISAVASKLERQNYTFKPVNILKAGKVPEDCDLLFIADPRVDFLAAEREQLLAYNARGGAMLALLEPGHSPGLAVHMAQYGIDVGENIVLEANPNYQVMGGDASNLVVGQNQMTDHPITEPIVGMVLLRVARTVQALQPPLDGFDVGELLLTSDYAWGETTLDGLTMPQPDEGEDPMGRLGLAAVSVSETGGRVVVFGDSDFASNELLDQASNFDLLPNAIAWLVGEEDQVSIRPNPGARGTFTMSTIQGLIVWLVSVLLIPAVMIGGAVATWLMRRKR